LRSIDSRPGIARLNTPSHRPSIHPSVPPQNNTTQDAKSVVEQLREGLRIHVVKLDAEEMVFDLIGVDASLANALRRILLAEVRFSSII
jgi:hypothetical protein